MIKTMLAVAAGVIGVPILLVVVLMSPQVAHSRQAGSAACVAMLGHPPTPESTVAGLGGREAETVAVQTYPPGTLLPTGESAYEFVTTLNTITNWRALPPQAVAAWVTNPAQVPAPPGAVIEQHWSAPDFTPDQREVLARHTPSSYDKACAVMLRRIEEQTATTTATQPPPSSASPSAALATDGQRTQILARITARIGTTITEADLWQLVSPTPQLDARRTAFSQLTAHPGAITDDPRPGDVLCYDFTTWGPTHCALITAAASPTQIAVIAADGKLAVAIAPDNNTTIHPVSTSAPDDANGAS